ncbi:GNAT family N-acetyltransferase [Falsirhodobacter sp. 20TX0035]|uniref:GNAT family N-acetyltransferase n=1 Tax=Falsirhodobacter sp. 20TX0035 TaxID=3022019 RepID=UPI00232B9F6C|nr:GNAT family N-acetyltransferase [Falsirhodobacter sp. 20TX0035]MDB6454327.1 GNAT family N-acetyltransferase [Falsirhodobacter sp. 20TX0035]
MTSDDPVPEIRDRGAPAPAPERDLSPQLRIDAYDARTRPLGPAERRSLHELTVSVLWPHRDHDLDLFLSLGQGYLATDEIGRALGSAMWFPMGEDFAMLGMMVTVPRLQSRGAGRWLLRNLLHATEERDLRLSATRSGYRLYQAAGFVPVGLIRQQQGIATAFDPPADLPGLRIRPARPGDEVAIRALDTHAFGATRARVLDALLPLSHGMVAERKGQLCGYALSRPFGRGTVVGPLVAEDDDMALRLAAPLIARNTGRFTRLDTPVTSPAFVDFLRGAGLIDFDTVTEMRIGPHRRATEGAVTYALAAHSLG